MDDPKKVYCRWCRWVEWESGIPDCKHKKSQTVIIKDSSVKQRKTIEYKQCSEINKNNDCQDYQFSFITRIFNDRRLIAPIAMTIIMMVMTVPYIIGNILTGIQTRDRKVQEKIELPEEDDGKPWIRR